VVIRAQLDRDRGAYGIKETALAREYVHLLDIAATSGVARSLIQWKKPSNGRAAGNFAEMVEAALRDRSAAESRVDVARIDSLLTSLAKAPDKEARRPVLRQLLTCTTARQQKWLVRVILRDLKLGMSEKTILRVLHEDAEEYYNITSSLRKVWYVFCCWGFFFFFA
jgi:DNA ligase-4